MSVVGPSLTFADAYATAGFAMGVRGVAWAASSTGYAAMGITPDGRVLSSPGSTAWSSTIRPESG